MSSLPPWKLALMERKRRQDGGGGGGGVSVGVALPPKPDDGLAPDVMAGAPSWMRDIQLKKNQQKNSILFIGRMPAAAEDGSLNDRDVMSLMTHNKVVNRRSYVPTVGYNTPTLDGGDLNLSLNQRSSSESSICENNLSVHIPPVEERILPIKKNPILLLDLEKRQYGHSFSGSTGHSPSGHPPVKSELYATDGFVARAPRVDRETDEVFGEDSENITYGKGFVNKLLQRFSNLSYKDEHVVDQFPSPRSPKRSHSSGDMMHGDTQTASLYRYNENQSKRGFSQVTRSYDDLLQETSQPLLKVNNDFAGSMPSMLSDSLSIPNGCVIDEEEHPQVNTVSNVRNIFESFKELSPPQKPPISQKPPVTTRVFRPIDVSQKGVEARDLKTSLHTDDNTFAKTSLHSDDNTFAQRTHTKDYENHLNVAHDSLSTDKRNGFQVSSSSDYKKDINENETRLGNSENGQRASNSRTFPSYLKNGPPVKTPSVSSAGTSGSVSITQSVLPNSNNYDSTVSNVNNYVNETSDENIKKDIKIVVSSPFRDDAPVVPTAPRGDTAIKVTPVTIKAAAIIDKNDVVKQWPKVQTTQTVTPRPTVSRSLVDEVPIQKTNVINDVRTNGSGVNVASMPTQRVSPPDNSKSDFVKRPVPSRPGMLLIRPASNLIASKTKTEYLELTKYNDVKNGEFAPATRRFINEGAVNNEDVIDGDDEDEGSRGVGRKFYEFTGAAVLLGRSLLAKTKRHAKVCKIKLELECHSICCKLIHSLN